MAKIRILFLAPVDAGNINAQSLNTREIALRLDAERFECTLLYLDSPDRRLVGRSNLRLVKLPGHGRTWRVLREMFGRHQIIAYMTPSPATYLFLQTPRRFRGKTRTVLHAEAPMAQTGKQGWLARVLSHGVLYDCDDYTGITPYVARDVQQNLGHEAGYILPVGVDVKRFQPALPRPGSMVTVLFAGTLIERKGPQLVLEAATRFPQARFRLIGPGRDGYDQVLRRKIAEMKLANVVLEGPQPQEGIVAAMGESDIFLLPSRLEGLPKVTLEAAASGLPCIVFRDYETPSVVDGVTGFQVATVEEMTERLGQLIADFHLRCALGEAARRHAASFDWDQVARQWQNAYLSIAASAS
ncbi:MAG TPA: glycosyltransferase family 4 protein [Terriglobales bacterium]|nr:glycosyltransferase family 4 protein [Terriglobales bacterium]